MIIKTNVRDTILANYNQVELFAKYLEIDVEDINYCLEENNNCISNPLRNDNNPSLTFFYIDNKLYMWDMAMDEYRGDIFEIIGLLSDKNCNNSKDFIEICKYITKNNNISLEVKQSQIGKIAKSFKIIKVEEKGFGESDKKYWNKLVPMYHLRNRNVFSVDKVWITDMTFPTLFGSIKNPVFAYYLDGKGNDAIYQIYNPFGKKHNKFFTNNKGLFQALHEIYISRVLIIAKSRKDKLVIESFLEIDGETIAEALNKRIKDRLSYDDLHEYCVTSFNSESNRIPLDVANRLKELYDEIIIFADYDKEGLLNGFYHYVLYGFKPVFLGREDISYTFTGKEVNSLINRILLINPSIEIYTGMFYQFVKDNSNTYDVKDLYEFGMKYEIKETRNLINNLFYVNL